MKVRSEQSALSVCSLHHNGPRNNDNISIFEGHAHRSISYILLSLLFFQLHHLHHLFLVLVPCLPHSASALREEMQTWPEGVAINDENNWKPLGTVTTTCSRAVPTNSLEENPAAHTCRKANNPRARWPQLEAVFQVIFRFLCFSLHLAAWALVIVCLTNDIAQFVRLQFLVYRMYPLYFQLTTHGFPLGNESLSAKNPPNASMI